MSEDQTWVPASLDPCLKKCEPGEPMFILLARDSAVPDTIEWWCQKRLHEIHVGSRPDTPEEREHIAQFMRKADIFREWRKINR